MFKAIHKVSTRPVWLLSSRRELLFLWSLSLLLTCCLGEGGDGTILANSSPKIIPSLDEHRKLQTVPVGSVDGSSTSELLADLSEKVENLTSLVQTLQPETTQAIKGEIDALQTSVTVLFDDFQKSMQTSLLNERKAIISDVTNLAEDWRSELQGLQRELEEEAAILLTELEVGVQKTVTIGAVGIGLFLLMALSCGCGCGACVVYLTTRRAQQLHLAAWSKTMNAYRTERTNDKSLLESTGSSLVKEDENDTVGIFRDEDVAIKPNDETAVQFW
jgi:hypothetical protein